MDKITIRIIIIVHRNNICWRCLDAVSTNLLVNNVMTVWFTLHKLYKSVLVSLLFRTVPIVLL